MRKSDNCQEQKIKNLKKFLYKKNLNMKNYKYIYKEMMI
jgi:hypothetical protein